MEFIDIFLSSDPVVQLGHLVWAVGVVTMLGTRATLWGGGGEVSSARGAISRYRSPTSLTGQVRSNGLAYRDESLLTPNTCVPIGSITLWLCPRQLFSKMVKPRPPPNGQSARPQVRRPVRRRCCSRCRMFQLDHFVAPWNSLVTFTSARAVRSDGSRPNVIGL